MPTLTERFQALFRNGSAYSGRVVQDGTPKGAATTRLDTDSLQRVQDHLDGKEGYGAVPVDEHGVSWWGCVDVDAHEDGVECDIVALEILLRDMPVLICQTRRKGAHIYIFGREELPTPMVRDYLAKIRDIAEPFGKPVEIFPKQDKLDKGNKGTWLNLPYFDAEDGHRYCIRDAQPLSLEEFVDLAESIRITAAELGKLVPQRTGMDMSQAPPCIVTLVEQANVDAGGRNNALFNYGVMLLKMGFEKTQILDEMWSFNQLTMNGEATKKTIKELVARITKTGTYNYLCQEEPIVSLCQKEKCGGCKFGWRTTHAIKDNREVDRTLFDRLDVVTSIPPTYYLHVNGKAVQLEAEELLNYRSIRIRAMQQADYQVPGMKNEAWEDIFRELFKNRRHISAPKDANEDMAVISTLTEWCRNSEELTDGAPHLSVPDDLTKGRPVVMLDSDTGAPRTFFRASDFERELKRRKVLGYTGRELWAIMQRHACAYELLDNGIEAWSKPFTANETRLDVPVPEERF